MPLRSVDAVTLKQWMEQGEAVVVDVREPAEHASECIQGAVLVPLGSVTRAVLPDIQGKKLVVHCRSGGRSSNACTKLLAEDPALDIYNLEGGIGAWMRSGLAVKCDATRKVLPLDRQVQLTMGVALVVASALGYLVSPLFLLLTGFVGAGLCVAGLTGFCGLALVMAKMPWNNTVAPAGASCMIR